MMAAQRGNAPTAGRDNQTAGIQLTGVVKRYGAVTAVKGVTLELARGHLLALQGPSGCGNTTPLRLIAGFEQADNGTVAIGGNLVAGPTLFLPPEQRRVGMVFQDYALFPHLSVAQNIRFGLHRYSGNASRRVEQVLALVGLDGLGQRMPHELSGGQQQRVALARALAPEPDVVLLDEPFSNLDTGLRVRVRAEVRAILREANATAVFVTHDQEEALSLVDRVAVMIDGAVHQLATPQQVYRQPASRAVAAFVGDANFLAGMANGRRVETELGALETQNEVTGPVEVLIRPETVQLLPAAAPGPGASSRIRSQLFFGHDQLLTVQLASGTLLDARISPLYAFAVGQPIHVRIDGPVMVYPR
jgi:iron(III) transport system ATP-binding protein